MTEQVWRSIAWSTVKPLKTENSSYFVYDGWRWKDCGFRALDDGTVAVRCLRICQA